MHEDDEQLDFLLDAALSTYADPGADAELAQRILAHVAAEGARERTRRTIRWAIGLPVAACLLILFLLWVSKPLHHPADRRDEARVAVPKASDAGGSAGQGRSIANAPSVTARASDIARPLRRSSRAAATATAAHLPKLDVFPTPQPLTPAEREFVAYIAHASLAERRSLVEARQQMDAPLRIEALEIKPLEPPQPQGN